MAFRTTYHGDDLAALVNREVREATDRAARSIAQNARGTMLDTARETTPSRTGIVREAWIQHEVEHTDHRYETRISNSHPLIAILTYGTEPHEIEPRRHGGALATPSGPKERVHVSGIHGGHMNQRAAMAAEATLHETSATALETFKREVESSIESQKRRPR